MRTITAIGKSQQENDAIPDSEIDAAFGRLEEMVSALPSMQEKDDRLTRAREARRLIEVKDRTWALQSEIDHYQTIINESLSAARKAAETDDAEAEGRSLILVRVYTELRCTRLAAVQRSENELRELLKHGELRLDDPIEEYALHDDDYAALESEVIGFQQAYKETFDLCKQLIDSGSA